MSEPRCGLCCGPHHYHKVGDLSSCVASLCIQHKALARRVEALEKRPLRVIGGIDWGYKYTPAPPPASKQCYTIEERAERLRTIFFSETPMIDYAEFIRTLTEACVPHERWLAVSRAVEDEIRAAKRKAYADISEIFDLVGEGPIRKCLRERIEALDAEAS